MSQKERVWTVVSMLKWATDYFVEKNVQDPRLSIEWLLSEVLQVKRLDLYLQFDRPLTSNELNELRSLIKRRALNEPLQHITGSTLFLDATIHVGPDVLIPRIETEQLVDLLLEKTKPIAEQSVRLIDLGTGSGCIPISIKQKHPNWFCTGIDISESALSVAKQNAIHNQTEIEFIHQDIEQFIENSDRQWDVVISNPPYITESEMSEMHEQVLNYEPRLALFHHDPLNLYEQIIRFAASSDSQLFLECNDKTAKQVAAITGKYFMDFSLQKDLDGNDRFVIASNSLTHP
ncbi:MAG: peptide chain release factor N(5)-glutamine methyltransferase [Balneolaceae bacterium]